MALNCVKLTIEALEKIGYRADKCERTEGRRRSFDLHDIADVHAFAPDGDQVLLVQTTSNSGGHKSERMTRCFACPRLEEWISAPSRRFSFWIWRDETTVDVHQIELEHLAELRRTGRIKGIYNPRNRG